MSRFLLVLLIAVCVRHGEAEDNATLAAATTLEPSTTPAAETMSACGSATQRRLTVIKSEGFPRPYAADLDCSYVVRQSSAGTCAVTFLFNVFEVELSEDCRKDYVELAGDRLCGSKATGFSKTVPFTNSEVVMTFHSDNVTSGLGFMATVMQQECMQTTCDQEFSRPQFTLTSPNFPSPYDNKNSCDYIIVKSSPNVCRLKMEVQLFDVEFGERCEADFLEIGGNRLCGTLAPGKIVEVDFPEDRLVATFHSDASTSRDGFHLEVTQVECFQSTSAPPLADQAPTNATEVKSTTAAEATPTILPSTTDQTEPTKEVTQQ